MFWLTNSGYEVDSYVAFRGKFTLSQPSKVEIRLLGASWFVVWLDENYLVEGPARFDRRYPEYQTCLVDLPEGDHLVGIIVHHIGLDTRITENMPGFMDCSISVEGKELLIRWTCKKMDAYHSQVRRINVQLGWMEWCDTRSIPEGWLKVHFDDQGWQQPVEIDPGIGTPIPLTTASVQQFSLFPQLIAEGKLAETFGYERDDVSARFFLRDLECLEVPAQGVWRRYDLGQVRLGRPRFTLDVPSGTVVEFAYCEQLYHGRVHPYITLSGSTSTNMDHYVARGGKQEFFPLTPRGGRYLEVHILGNPDKIHFVKEEYLERCYHGEPTGSFHCPDDLLNQIWKTGVATFRACAEDAVIDNPTRERGQWTGDVVSVGMDIASVSYCDLRLLRRGLVQSAQTAREDGMVAGMSPGGVIYLSTYAAQWAVACLHYYHLTGDKLLLEELYPAAIRNFEAFVPAFGKDGVGDLSAWIFVDWGYVRSDAPVDIAFNLHVIDCLRAMVSWFQILNMSDNTNKYAQLEQQIEVPVRKWILDQANQGQEGWSRIGYHTTALALKMGFFKGLLQQQAIDALKCHLLTSFPNNPHAPRLSDPAFANQQIITPYFGHYSLPPLIESGEMDFVLDQYRRCWGWALEGGKTTWIEVFDPRWSHCHQWAGCPTWQLSRYVLGLHPRFDWGYRHFVMNFHPGSLNKASGILPIPHGLTDSSDSCEGEGIQVNWERTPEAIQYNLQITGKPVYIHLSPIYTNGESQVIELSSQTGIRLPQNIR